MKKTTKSQKTDAPKKKERSKKAHIELTQQELGNVSGGLAAGCFN